ncbi:MAG: BlaI/MecI/CopY family transcriptional regulator [Patescibacteria group bacterium]|nr:BlaI/MecI/CopY family transcriptional regulator [Patescibacteria group bacterium]
MKKIKPSNNALGELEAEIMKVIWSLEKASVREVLLCLKKKRKIAYTTVMTVMSRLYDKGILKRNLNNSGAHIYIPVSKNKKEFLNFVSKKAIDNLINEFGDLAVTQFLDIIENSDKKKLKEFQKRLKKIK